MGQFSVITQIYNTSQKLKFVLERAVISACFVCFSVTTVSRMVSTLLKSGKITKATADVVTEYLRTNRFDTLEYGVETENNQ